jgi:hypothetical protein
VSRGEQAKYSVMKTHDNIEMLDHAPMNLTEAETSGDREKAINTGFGVIVSPDDLEMQLRAHGIERLLLVVRSIK